MPLDKWAIARSNKGSPIQSVDTAPFTRHRVTFFLGDFHELEGARKRPRTPGPGHAPGPCPGRRRATPTAARPSTHGTPWSSTSVRQDVSHFRLGPPYDRRMAWPPPPPHSRPPMRPVGPLVAPRLPVPPVPPSDGLGWALIPVVTAGI